MLIAIPEDVVPFAVVDPDTLVIHLLIVNWNLAVKILVEPMLNVNLKADLPYVNVPMDTVEILTPIVFVILAVQIPAVSFTSRILMSNWWKIPEKKFVKNCVKNQNESSDPLSSFKM